MAPRATADAPAAADRLTVADAPIVPIIGGGPAGMSCALWLHNYEFHPIIIECESVLGGMAQRSPFPNEGLLGRPGESARENAHAFSRHIRQLAIETWLGSRLQRLRRGSDGQFRLDVTFAGAARTLSSSAVVIATGTRFNGEEWLDQVANARRMAEQGKVHVGAPWAAEPDSGLGSHVAVIGGGDNAFEVSRMLIDKGARVTIVMRSKAPKAQPSMIERLRKHEASGMVRVIVERTVQALDDAGRKLRLRLNDGRAIEADHVLLLLGYRPNSSESWMAELGLEQDKAGYIVVDGNMETSCPGTFAVGDVANPAHPCIATAVATGTIAAREISKRRSREAQSN